MWQLATRQKIENRSSRDVFLRTVAWNGQFDHKNRAVIKKKLQIICISTRLREYQRFLEHLGRMENFCIPRLLYEYQPEGRRDHFKYFYSHIFKFKMTSINKVSIFRRWSSEFIHHVILMILMVLIIISEEPSTSILRVLLVNTSNTTQCMNQEYQHLNLHHYENLTPKIKFSMLIVVMIMSTMILMTARLNP